MTSTALTIDALKHILQYILTLKYHNYGAHEFVDLLKSTCLDINHDDQEALLSVILLFQQPCLCEDDSNAEDIVITDFKTYVDAIVHGDINI